MIGPLTPLRPDIRIASSAPEDAVPCIGLRDPEKVPADLESAWLRLRGAPRQDAEVLLAPADPPTLLVGLGSVEASDRPAATRIGAAIVTASAGFRTISLDLSTFRGVNLQGLFEGMLLAAYRFDRYRSQPKPPRLEAITLRGVDGGEVAAALARACVVARGVYAARDLVNEPGSVATAAAIADFATRLGAEAGFTVEAWGLERLRKEDFGGLIGVNRGSVAEPRFLMLDYTPEGAARTLALVGKGVTFDSGGLNTKSTRDMTRMKKDMAGGAAVIGVFSTLRDLGIRQRVRGFIPLTDNMSGPDAMRPGDILRIRGGKTIEVLDTDNEGRLVLADALAYASEQAPDVLIDIATLTGTVAIALGRGMGALMGNDLTLMEALQASGRRTSEALWPFPLPEELRGQLRSEIADYRNNAELQGFSQIAAALLREFVPVSLPWAHIDMASPALLESGRHEHPPGATGWGVRLLLDLIEADAVH
jgi:leucyl aminopeptidase